MTRSESERIDDIFDAISAIEEAHRLLDFVAPSEELFRVVLDAVTFRLLVIGEAVKSLPEDFRDRTPEIPWNDIAKMRDVIAHHYFRLDAAQLWATIEKPLAQLKSELEKALGGERDEPRLSE